jgi:hypothetical protein
MGSQNKKYMSKDKPLLWYLEWNDHCGAAVAGWEMLSDATERSPVNVKTVGWIMHEGDEHVVVVPVMTEEGHVQGSMCLLKNNIAVAHLLEDPGDWDI